MIDDMVRKIAEPITIHSMITISDSLSDTTTAQPIAQARPKRQPKVPFKLQDFVRE